MINIADIEDIEIDNVYGDDYPHFTDAFVCSARWRDTSIELTDNELEELQNSVGYDDLVLELAMERARWGYEE
jgi:hypothetical protein